MNGDVSMSDRVTGGWAFDGDDNELVQRHDSKIAHDPVDQHLGVESLDRMKAAVEDTAISTEKTVDTERLDRPLKSRPLPLRESPNRTGISGLHIRTPTNTSDLSPHLFGTPAALDTLQSANETGFLLPASMAKDIPVRSASLRSVYSNTSLASSVSATSTLPSPFLAGMADLTPLPSPMMAIDHSESWTHVHTPSPRNSLLEDGKIDGRLQLSPTSTSPQRRRKGYGSLLHDAISAHAHAFEEHAAHKHSHQRDRSISDFKPDSLQNPRPRHVTHGSRAVESTEKIEYHMQREAYLAEQRGLTISPSEVKAAQLLTPPASNSSATETDEDQPFLEDGTATEYLEIQCGMSNKRRKFRQLRQLGQGTFSKVMLATREHIPLHPTAEVEERLDPHRLVAVKIVEHGPAGGADGERIEIGLKREVEMLKSVSHPCIIHLKACETQAHRTLLVLTYCPGGDLFDLANRGRELLKPPLVQRMFAELVSAVCYLHSNWIVHRDIKLENVLVNLSDNALAAMEDPRTHTTPILTLTDLGLSRRIPSPPASPLLETRCGSEDYAAPEILLGQPYDGRQTDAWALGVLLYALLEGRLPFDPPPTGPPGRSRNTHRIARCDWIWFRFGDSDGDWDDTRPGAAEFAGARPCVEGLLKKVRMGRKPLSEIEILPWVREGIRVPAGLNMREEDDDAGLL